MILKSLSDVFSSITWMNLVLNTRSMSVMRSKFIEELASSSLVSLYTLAESSPWRKLSTQSVVVVVSDILWSLILGNHQRQVSVARLCKNGPVLFCCFLWHFKSKMPDSSSLFFSLCTLLLLIVSTHRLCYTHFLATSLFSALQLQGPWLCTSVPKGDIVEDEP